MQKENISRMPSDENDKTNFAKKDEEQNHASLTTEQRPAETHNTTSNPDGDSVAENQVATSIDEE